MHYYEVAPLQIIRQNSHVFTYAHEEKLKIGLVVLVEVGRRQIPGIILREVNRPEYVTKPIISIIEKTPIPKPLLELSAWISTYYVTHFATVLQSVLPRGIHRVRRSRNTKSKVALRQRTNIVFNKDQLHALETIDKMSPGTALLHGVTGSGKTRVYIEAARRVLSTGRSVIVLVPEIALTTQVVDEFSAFFEDIILTHSKQTEAERHLAWQTALNSTVPRIIVGPRSALFMPLNDIGMIIVDEAHEPSLKQEQSPRYSALRAASVLANAHQAKVILGSATPSVADYYLALSSKRPIIEMSSKARKTQAPKVITVDMTKRQHFSRHRFLSNALLEHIEQTLVAGHQVLIFHNRRGSASTTLCEDCGWQATCARCFVPLTLHADHHKLRCHICGHSEKVSTNCPVCRNPRIIHKGIGTKLVETELAKLFPHATIGRFDGDNTTEQTLDIRYKELYSGSINLIIGTQVVAKGLDLPHLRSVGVIQADAGLSLPDFISPERTFQLLAQVVGRVGRSDHPTSVVVQSYQPSHPAIVDGLSQDFLAFYEKAIQERQQANFPPFTFLLKLTCTYKTEGIAIRNAQQLADILRSKIHHSVEILGPTPAFYERQRDTYRWQLILKSKKRSHLTDALQHLPSTNWQFELDPISLL